MALQEPSGGTFGCLWDDFLGPWDHFLGPGETFLRSARYFVVMCMNFYQPVPTFISFYQLLCQSLSISMNLYQSFSTYIHLL